ncbi:MAG: AzlD domain-containing protein [Gammaproteobacteria bacterium]
MSIRPDILALIFACLVVTFIPRIIPLMLAHRITLPRPILAWLAYIPTAVIAALFFNEMLLSGGTWRTWQSPHIWAGLAALATAFLSRHIATTIIIGMAVFAMLSAR